MIDTLPVGNARALAAELAARGLPGCRSMTAIETLRSQRRTRRPDAAGPDLAARFAARLLTDAVAEIRRRRGETTIEGKYGSETLAIVDRVPVERMTLLHAEGWRDYGRRVPARMVALSYLYGMDDAGPWAVRVPGTVSTVAGALAWITPAAVKAAVERGRRIGRQGDVYAIETTSAHDGAGELPEAHIWDPQTRTLTHQPTDGRTHAPLHLPHPVRFVVQRVYAMGRSGRRADGD